MAKFQFRKRFKITKGISLNVSKKGLGLSAGPKGIKVSRSAQGRITGSVGIPGSGISYRDRLDRTNNESSESAQESEDSNSNAFLEDVADKSEYILKHGKVLTNREMRLALSLHASNFVLCILWPLSVMFWSFEYVLNPFVFALILVWVFLFKETRKNKRLWNERVKEHSKVCEHE